MSVSIPRYVTVRAISWSFISLFLISMLTSSYVLYRGQEADAATRVTIAQVAKNTHSVCEANQKTARESNAILEGLIKATNGSVNNARFKAAQAIRYRAIEVPVLACN
jgi:hypothetical protein